ncbi:MAG: UDP-N-acetylmuramate--L-alanine ligase [Bacillota bacterium]
MAHFHFVAIGGAGMSALARALLAQGHTISGSDIKDNEATARLSKLGAIIHLGHSRENVTSGTNVVVVSSAIHDDNPEVLEARERGIPVIHRSDLLAQLMNAVDGVAVAGCHGKTTTTTMIGIAFQAAGLDPTILVGGEVSDFGGNAVVGKSSHLIAEADESDGSFLKLRPRVAVATNVDNDHLDYWGSVEAIAAGFRQFLDNVKPSGYCVVCQDDALLRNITEDVKRKVVTYGLRDGKVKAREVVMERWGSRFTLESWGCAVGSVRLNVPGLHNVQNSLAAFGVALEEGFPLGAVAEALECFKGVDRRLQKTFEARGVTVFDDYAHHPTEIKASLAALKNAGFERLTVVFQPHRYSRTALLASEFGKAFAGADEVIVLPIYPGPGEKEMPGVTSDLVVRSIVERGGYALPANDFREACQLALDRARQGGAIVTMGAGDVWKVGKMVEDVLGH